jgi:hypothetical protein
MTGYRLREGDTLALRVDDGPWQTVVFDPAHFPGATVDDTGGIEVSGADLAAAADALDGVTATVDDDGRVVLATADSGESAILEIDPACAAAAALGLGAGVAHGAGPGHARLVGAAAGPYELPVGAELVVQVDAAKPRTMTFDEDGHEEWTAEQIAASINKQARRKVAAATGDGHVRLASPTQGVGSRVEVGGDAAAVLGFTGPAALSDPYRAEPARLVCRPAGSGGRVVVENLTPAPIELHLPTGRQVLPARGRLVVGRDAADDALLRHLAAHGTVRTSPERNA